MKPRILLSAVVAAAIGIVLIIVLLRNDVRGSTGDQSTNQSSRPTGAHHFSTAADTTSIGTASAPARSEVGRSSAGLLTTTTRSSLQAMNEALPANAVPSGSSLAARSARLPTSSGADPAQLAYPNFWAKTGSDDGYSFTTDHDTVHSGSSSALLSSAPRPGYLTTTVLSGTEREHL